MNSKFLKIKELNENIQDSSVKKNICVFGQGFVGLPLTLSFAFRGCNAIGVDVNQGLVDDTNKGLTHHTEKFYDVTIKEILKMQLEEGRYRATTDAADAVRRCNNIIVTVGIPIYNGEFIIEHLSEACIVIGRNLKKGDLVIIRSTVIPGATEEIVLPILERESGMKAGEEFYLAYASERIAEGNAFDEFANMPTLVAGVNEISLERAKEVLSIVCKADMVQATNIKAVETSKVFENVQRDVNIALSQEFARFTEALGIDTFEVIRLANTHKRVNLLMPGPGVGGYCIPNAYHYLSPKANKLGVNLDLLKLSREKNEKLPQFIVEKVENLLIDSRKEISGSKIAVLGLAMKDYSNDDRISPPIDIVKLLIKKGANVMAFDPVVPTKYPYKVSTQEEALKDADVVLVLAKQNEINFSDLKFIKELMKESPIYVDTKAVVEAEKAREYGFKYWRI